jgi:general secretion pathway protein G
VDNQFCSESKRIGCFPNLARAPYPVSGYSNRKKLSLYYRATSLNRNIHIANSKAARGLTLIELIVATTILLVLSSMAVPMARVTIKRERERQLRQALWAMRDGIDKYKDAADRGAFQIKVGSEGYPPDLDTLVNGVDVGGKKMRFLRRIPIDPMTGGTDWGLRAMQDDPDSDSWNGENVFDVYTKSAGTGLDGTKYKDW